MGAAFNSPFIVPIGAFVMVLGIVIAAIYSGVQTQRIRAHQRMTLVAQGKSAEEIEHILGTASEDKSVRDPLRSLANARRTAVVLISTGLGLSAFFSILAMVLQQREVYSGAACGIIPIFIGIGFLIDYQLQKRELARFGLEVDAD